MRKLLLILMILACCTMSALAEIYSWTDEKGVKHFSSTPPDAENYQKNTEIPYDAKKDEAQSQAYQQWLEQKRQEEAEKASEQQKQAEEQKKEEKKKEEKDREEAEKARLEAEKAQAEAEEARLEQQKKKRYVHPNNEK